MLIEISSNSTAPIYNEYQITNPGRHVDYLAVALKTQSFGVEPLNPVQNTEGMKVQLLWPCTPGARPYSEAEQFMYFQHLFSRYDEFVGSSFWFSFDGLWEVTDELDLAGV